MSITPFVQVKVGQIAVDFMGEERMAVIATGTLDELKKYDSTGACDYMQDEDDKNQMIAVVDSDGQTYLYVYGDTGVYVPLARMEQLKEAISELDPGEFEELIGFMAGLAEAVNDDNSPFDPAWHQTATDLRQARTAVQKRRSN